MWGSNTIVASRLLTIRVVKPLGPRCSAHVAEIARRPLQLE
jgi:hypothetical protein